jgi:hypothetical protein
MIPEQKAKQLMDKYGEHIHIANGEGLDEFLERTKELVFEVIEDIEEVLTEYGKATEELQNMESEFREWEKVRKEVQEY